MPATTQRNLLLHPIVLFTVVWLTVALLYAMHLSKLLIFNTGEVLDVILTILATYLVTVSAVLGTRWVLVKTFPGRLQAKPIDESKLDARLKRYFLIWIAATIVEIIVSGGIPIVWLVQGSSKTYFDFGIPSLHGLLNALLLSLSLCNMGLFLRYGRKRHLVVPVFVMFWSAMVITRNMMIVNLLQCVLIWLRMRAVRYTTIMLIAIVAAAALLVFGFIGDLRTGAEAFRALAQPTDTYPTWLPSGVLWVYIYLTTPINNVVFTIHSWTPTFNVLFPNTTSLLFPSVLRNAIYPMDASTLGTGDLVTEAFNVSTAFAGPYQDFGTLGVVAFTALIGFCAAIYWTRNSFKHALIYAVIGQCLLMTVFYNHFFYLPIISQIGWIYFLCRKGGQRAVAPQ